MITNECNLELMARYEDSYFDLAIEKRIHRTQKPVNLYRWILQNYAKKGDLILDTHLGSGSIQLACDIEDFDQAIKRIEDSRKQTKLF